MKIKLILTDSIYFFLNNLPQIATLCLPWIAAGGLVEYLIITMPAEPDSQPMIIMAWAFNLLVLPVYTAALIQLMAKQAQHKHPMNKELLTDALKVWQPVFFLYLLMIGIVGALLIGTLLGFTILGRLFGTAAFNTIFNSGFGFVLFILVGLLVWVRLSFALFYLVLESRNPIQAVQKSFHATRPYTHIIILTVLSYVAPLIAAILYSGSLLPENNPGHAIRALIGVAGSFLLLFVNVLLFRIYMSAVKQDKPDTA